VILINTTILGCLITVGISADSRAKIVKRVLRIRLTEKVPLLLGLWEVRDEHLYAGVVEQVGVHWRQIIKDKLLA